MDFHPRYHYKYCPRCGNKGDFSSEHLAFKCHRCEFQFYLNSSAAVVALIYNAKNELLFSRRGVEPDIGKLDLPGGFVDPGESVEAAVVREIEEELDLKPDSIEYIGSFPNEYRFSGTIVNTIDLVFNCYVSDFSTLKFRDDIIGIEFINPFEVNLDDIPFKSIKNIIKQIRNGK